MTAKALCLIAAMLAKVQHLRGTADFASCKEDFSSSRFFGQDSEEVPTLWLKLVKHKAMIR